MGFFIGDISLRLEVFCFIMIIEILRLMLYRGVDIIRDIEWVRGYIFLWYCELKYVLFVLSFLLFFVENCLFGFLYCLCFFLWLI